MIYLASPYTYPNAQVREERFEIVRRVTMDMLALGLPVFSPITYCHQFATEFDHGTSAEVWWNFNREMLKKADIFVVLLLDGWSTSSGVQQERALASMRHIHEFFLADPTVPSYQKSLGQLFALYEDLR